LNESCDIAVIGAGPAGLAAAALAAGYRARTVLLDEQPGPGGQIYRGIERMARDNPALLQLLGPDYGRGLDLVRDLRASSVDYRTGSSVWQITPHKQIWYSRSGTSRALTARVILLATGAIERPVPLPGWTLPGVMTAGALQILLKSSGAMPTKPLVLIGAGPLLLLLASQYLDAGMRPTAVLDTAKSSRRWAAVQHLPGALGATGRKYLAKGLALMSALRRGGVPVFRNVEDVAIQGTAHAEAVVFTGAGRRQRVAAGLIGLHEGVLPSQQVARSLQCDFEWSAAQHSFRPVVDDWGRSSVAGVLIAGDGAGIGGAIAAEHGGRIAALEALHQAGRIDENQRNAAALPERRAQRDHLAIRPLIDALYPPSQQLLNPADDVVICRCEEVQAGALRSVIALGCQGPNQAKSFLRCGMGPCQGRLCGPTVSDIFAQTQNRALDDVGYYRIRPPLKPLTVREFAQIDPGA
jgi:NADPH-dependent 2,4-dienoyl-CoA reductase/sulfur reductase-like enzyme